MLANALSLIHEYDKKLVPTPKLLLVDVRAVRKEESNKTIPVLIPYHNTKFEVRFTTNSFLMFNIIVTAPLERCEVRIMNLSVLEIKVTKKARF